MRVETAVNRLTVVETAINRFNRLNIRKPVGLVRVSWNSGWFGSLLFEPVNHFSVPWKRRVSEESDLIDNTKLRTKAV